MSLIPTSPPGFSRFVSTSLNTVYVLPYLHFEICQTENSILCVAATDAATALAAVNIACHGNGADQRNPKSYTLA